ncbi:MAG: hypothetical protein NZL83_02345 [Candidatus Absconditabacterales bacterium]|nr:hypothetical protein [Candidatus Absconditabacterales bacterium]
MPAYLGQHLLTDTTIRLAIANHIHIFCVSQNISTLIEIGPGKGSLTDLIHDITPRFCACELDQNMITHLTKTHHWDHHTSTIETIIPSMKKVLLHHNALDLDMDKLQNQRDIDRTKTLIIGNLPYYITSPLLIKYALPTVAGCIFLIQDDVTEKIVTNAKKKSFLWRKLTAIMHITKTLHVPPLAFTPPPKVQSSVITMTPLPPNQQQKRVTPIIYDLITKLSHAKRKTIRANARKAGLDRSSWDPRIVEKRIEELSWNDIQTIAYIIDNTCSQHRHNHDQA